MLTATEILDMLNASDEDIRIESKTGSDVDRSILETICAYSNEPGLDGGYIILGTHRENDEKTGSFIYNICGYVPGEKLPLPEKNKTYPAREETYPAREALFYGLPDELKDKIMTVGKKTGTDEMTSIILELCTYSEFGIADLAKLLKRNEKYIKTTFIKPLRAQKKLFFTIPEMPNHPGQKYTTAEPTTKG